MSYDDFDGVLGSSEPKTAKKVVSKMTDDKIDGLVDMKPKVKAVSGRYSGRQSDWWDDDDTTYSRGSSFRGNTYDNNVYSRPAGRPSLSHVSVPILLGEGAAFVADTHPNVSDGVFAKFTQAQWSQLVDNLMYDLEKTLKDEAGLAASVPFGRDQLRRELSKFVFDNFRHEDKTGRKRFLDVNGVRK
jgi:hypothetical protein